MRERAKPRVKDYREITPELGVSANRLAELAYEALAADYECCRPEDPAAT